MSRRNERAILRALQNVGSEGATLFMLAKAIKKNEKRWFLPSFGSLYLSRDRLVAKGLIEKFGNTPTWHRLRNG